MRHQRRRTAIKVQGRELTILPFAQLGASRSRIFKASIHSATFICLEFISATPGNRSLQFLPFPSKSTTWIARLDLVLRRLTHAVFNLQADRGVDTKVTQAMATAVATTWQ
jgi:hypothetical protein